jgi:hypothetical protein
LAWHRTLVNKHRPYGLAAYLVRDSVLFQDQALAAACAAPPELRFPPTPTRPPPPPPLTAEQLPWEDDNALELQAPAEWSGGPVRLGVGDDGSEAAGSPAAAAAVAAEGERGGSVGADDPPFYGLLILVPLRLGLHSLNPLYDGAIKVRPRGERYARGLCSRSRTRGVRVRQACLRLPQCVGIAGGRPNSAYYFMGYEGAGHA